MVSGVGLVSKLGLILKSNTQQDGSVKPLEERMLPALAVRCAQHILKWGVQEEGLFRSVFFEWTVKAVLNIPNSISGRSSHVAKLRSEFDAGMYWTSRRVSLCSCLTGAVEAKLEGMVPGSMGKLVERGPPVNAT